MSDNYKMSKDEKRKLYQISAGQKACNLGFNKACEQFTEQQMKLLIAKDKLFISIAGKMGLDYKKVHAEGMALKVSEDYEVFLVPAVKQQTPKPEGVK